MLRKTTNSVTTIGVIGQVCVEAPAPPIPPTPPPVPRPPTPGLPPVAPPSGPYVIRTYDYTDEFGKCWTITEWGDIPAAPSNGYSAFTGVSITKTPKACEGELNP